MGRGSAGGLHGGRARRRHARRNHALTTCFLSLLTPAAAWMFGSTPTTWCVNGGIAAAWAEVAWWCSAQWCLVALALLPPSRPSSPHAPLTTPVPFPFPQKYYNVRASYISAFFDVINWKGVSDLYAVAKEGAGSYAAVDVLKPAANFEE